MLNGRIELLTDYGEGSGKITKLSQMMPQSETYLLGSFNGGKKGGLWRSAVKKASWHQISYGLHRHFQLSILMHWWLVEK